MHHAFTAASRCRVVEHREGVGGCQTSDRRLSGDSGVFQLPPVVTQRAIADYLDRETARIDALIAAKRRMVELLEERCSVLVELDHWRSTQTSAARTSTIGSPDGSRLASARLRAFADDGIRTSMDDADVIEPGEILTDGIVMLERRVRDSSWSAIGGAAR